MGIDGRIFPAGTTPEQKDKATGHLDFMDAWYPVQVKQKDKASRPDIDSFEAKMARADRTKGFFVLLRLLAGCADRNRRLFPQERPDHHPANRPGILDEQIARKLA